MCMVRLCAANQETLAAREACRHQATTDEVLCNLQSSLCAIEADIEQV